MRKNLKVLLFTSILAISVINISYGFSIHKTTRNIDRADVFKYLKGSEFIKLSATEWSEITGEKMNFWNKLSFKIAKMKIKHDLKKNNDLLITNYFPSNHKSSFLHILYWVLIGFVLALGLLLLLLTQGQKK